MKRIIPWTIPILFLLSAAFTDNVPCGDASFFRVSFDDIPAFHCCLSDSFHVLKFETERDSFKEMGKDEFVYFEMYSTESNSNQLFYAILKDKANGKTYTTQLTCDNSSVSFSGFIRFKKLHQRSAHSSDLSVTVMKIVNAGKDTLRCEPGNIHIEYLAK
jgi:hypothetical protein